MNNFEDESRGRMVEIIFYKPHFPRHTAKLGLDILCVAWHSQPFCTVHHSYSVLLAQLSIEPTVILLQINTESTVEFVLTKPGYQPQHTAFITQPSVSLVNKIYAAIYVQCLVLQIIYAYPPQLLFNRGYR